jgi:hypothetical protein
MACPLTDICPLYPLFTSEELLEIWKIAYCEKPQGYAKCERFKIRQQGDDPPVDLLPNGDTLPTDDPDRS